MRKKISLAYNVIGLSNQQLMILNDRGGARNAKMYREMIQNINLYCGGTAKIFHETNKLVAARGTTGQAYTVHSNHLIILVQSVNRIKEIRSCS